MSLLAYNLTTAPLLLAAGAPSVTLPPSASAGSRGPAFNVTGELKGLLSPPFALLQAQVAAGQVQYEWSALPEYNTFSLVVGSAQTDVDDLDSIVFVDSATGNDANPGTATQPVQTLKRGMELVPPSHKRSSILSLLPGSYVWPTGMSFVVPNAVGPKASPFVLLGAFTDELGTVAATAGSTDVVLATTQNVGLDAYRGAYLLCVVGANAGRRRQITGNTAGPNSAFSVNASFQAVIGVGDTFIVERPAVDIELQSGPTVPNIMGDGRNMGMKGLHFFNATFRQLFFDRVTLIVEACTFENVFPNTATGVFLPRSIAIPWTNMGVNNPFSSLRIEAGVYVTGGGLAASNNGGNISGFVVADFSDFYGVSGGALQLFNFNARAAQCFVQGNAASVFFQARPTPRASIDGDLYGAVYGLIDVSGGAALGEDADEFPGAAGIDLSNNSVGPGIRVKGRSYAFMDDVGGAGNATYGIEATRMSQTATNGTCTVTGTLNNTLVGATPKAYAALPFSEVDGSGPTLNRIE